MIAFTRKPHRLNPIDYLGQKWCFVTMCCENRNPIFLDGERAAWILTMLREVSVLHRFLVDAYCVMPDHLHFLGFGTDNNCNLLAFAKSFKQKTAYSHQKLHGVRLWQRNYYDHMLRASDTSGHVAAYIWLNPVRKGLCKNFADYPYSGSFSRPWKAPLDESGWLPPWKQPKMPA